MDHRSALRRVATAFIVALVATPVVATTSFAGTSSAPTNFTLVSGHSALGVSWTESTKGKVTFAATAASAGHAARACVARTTESCAIHGLANGVVYSVTVVATDSGGSSSPSAAVTDIVGVPGAPSHVRAAAGTAAASVSWTPPPPSGVSSLTGYMATASPGGFSCSTAATLLTPPARECVIPGLTSGTRYSVTVTATNAFGTGAPSKAVTVTLS
jgi:Fibronectin type III domain